MNTSLKLFCIPCAGASATMYLRWRRLLPTWIEVVPVELPGRGIRLDEIGQTNYAALTEILLQEIAQSISGRYALFGHSMGALLAYGIARGLHGMPVTQPDALMVSGCAAPACQDCERYRKNHSEATLIADLSKQGGTPAEVFNSRELLSMTLDLLRTDYCVCGSFQYTQQTPFPVPIHCFGGRSDDIDPANLIAWRNESNRAFTLDWFDGGHFFLRQSEDWFIYVLKKRLLENRKGTLHDLPAIA